MNKFKILLTVALLMLFSACGTKTMFKPKQPMPNAALVYVYVTDILTGDDDMQDTKFKIQINNKNVKGYVGAGEYKVFDMKPATILISVVRGQIEREDLKLKLKAGQTYYIKVDATTYGEPFALLKVDTPLGKRELNNKALSGAFEFDATAYVPDFAGSTAKSDAKTAAIAVPTMSEAEIDAIIEKKLAQRSGSFATPVTTKKSVSSTGSKLDDIKEAYEMKKSGLLTDEEFKTMKAEILAK